MGSRLPPLEGRPWPFTADPVEVRARRGTLALVVVVSALDEASATALERCVGLARRVGETEVVALHAPRHRFAADPGVAADWFGRLAPRLCPAGDPDPVAVRPLHDPELESWARLDPLGWPTVLVVDERERVVGAGLGIGAFGPVAEALADAAAARAERRARRPEGAEARRGDTPTTASLPALSPGRAPRSGRRRRLGSLRWPSGIAVQGDLVAVADSGNDRVLLGRLDGSDLVVTQDWPVEGARRVTLGPGFVAVSRPSAGIVETLPTGIAPGSERPDATVLADGLRRPVGLTVDRDGSVVIADAGADRLLRYRSGEEPGRPEDHVICGTGETGLLDGPAHRAELCQPIALTRVAGGLLFLDAGTASIRFLDDRGRVSTLTSNPPDEPGLVDGTVHRARFQHPLDLAAADDTVWLADTGNRRLRALTGRAISTLGLRGLGGAEALAATAEGRLVVADTAAHRLALVDPSDHTVTQLTLTECPELRDQRLSRAGRRSATIGG